MEQGERRPESARISVRVAIAGLVLGVAFGVTNLWVGLRLGATFTLTLAAGVLSFGALTALSKLRGASAGADVGEATLAQTVAGAAMSMPSSGLVNAIPALAMSNSSELADAGFVSLAIWVIAVSLLGVFVAALLRPIHVRDETLRFPSATAAAEALRSMGSSKSRAIGDTKRLGIVAAAGAVVRVVIDKLDVSTLALPGTRMGIPINKWGAGFDPSLLALATGALLGPRLGASIFVGVAITVGAGPNLLQAGALTVKSQAALASALSKWTIWPGASLVSAAAVVAILWRVPSIVSAARRVRSSMSSSGATRAESRPIVAAITVAGLLCVVLARAIFHLGVGAAIFSVVLSIAFSAVAARVYGETDTVPSGPLGKLTQLALVPVAPGNVTSSLVAANITAGAATHSAELTGDLKTGELIGVSPRQQLFAQVIGVTVGGVASVATYRMLVASGRVFTPAVPATAAKAWVATSELLAHGLSGLPIGAGAAAIAAIAVGVILAVVERTVPSAWKSFVPSPVGIGLGMLLPAGTALTVFAGSVLAALAKRFFPRLDARTMLIVAAGLMVSESLVDVAATLLSH